MVPFSDGGVNNGPSWYRAGDLERSLLDLRREVGDVVFGEALTLERGRLRGKRLRRRGALAGYGGWRNGALLDRPYRLAVRAIEHVQEALLARLRERLDPFPVHCDVGKDRRGWKVVVPQAVMHALEMPHALSRSRVEAHQRFANRLLPRR
jgi:hypothetical protein